jgi:hypothetical protein
MNNILGIIWDVVLHRNDPKVEQYRRIRGVMNKPLLEVANYCDHICYHAVKEQNVTFLRPQLVGTITAEEYPIWNLTSVGNIARVIVDLKDNEIVEAAKKSYNNYRDWLDQQLVGKT